MQMALYEPGLGYYSAGSSKFGQSGDFVTAPEISSVFSRILARQCDQILHEISGASILEIGPGTGRMACDILHDLEQKNNLPEKYFLMETSADLRERQYAMVLDKIPHLQHHVEWLDSLHIDGFNGIILANEVLDALPVNRIRFNGNACNEYCVVSRNDEFDWSEVPVGDALEESVIHIKKSLQHPIPDGYVTEICLFIPGLIKSLADIMERGIMIFIDYGYPRNEYYHPQRKDGTLLCHYQNYCHSDPFYYPGLQDITASVDFTGIAESAIENNLQVQGFTTQAHFLMGCGLEQILDEVKQETGIDPLKISQQVKTLTLPGEMGERFKVISLCKGIELPLMGFQLTDMRQRL